MRIHLLVSAVFLMSSSAVAAAQAIDPVTLSPGQAVTLRFDDAGRAIAVERGSAEWTPFDVAVARSFVGGEFDDAIGNNVVPLTRGTGVPEPPPVAPNVVRIRFFDIAGRHSQLVIENGHDRGFLYRARIGSEQTMQRTDVCVVARDNRGVEHWPWAIARIELSQLQLIPWRAGQAITCE